MGYDLSICRRDDWREFGSNITLEEWLEVCRADSMLEAVEGDASMKTPDGLVVTAKLDAPRVRWFDPSGGKTFAWLHFRRGEIKVTNPDPPTVAKLCEIAAKLSARVQGDEGEFYNSDGSTFSG